MFTTPPSTYKNGSGRCKECRRVRRPRNSKIAVVCKNCGIEFKSYPSDNRQFCSRRCKGLASRGKREKHLIPVVCPVCDKNFEVWPYRIAENQTVYCSRSCSAIARPRVRKISTKNCLQCGLAFDVGGMGHSNKQQYCSHKCYSASLVGYSVIQHECLQCHAIFEKPNWKAYRSAKYCSRKCLHESQKISIAVICAECGRYFETFPARVQAQKYCDRECRRLVKPSRLRSGAFWKHHRHLCLVRDDFECQICGKQSESNHAHHIIKARLFDKNDVKRDQLDNLITLCASCHREAEHDLRYQDLWMEERGLEFPNKVDQDKVMRQMALI